MNEADPSSSPPEIAPDLSSAAQEDVKDTGNPPEAVRLPPAQDRPTPLAATVEPQRRGVWTAGLGALALAVALGALALPFVRPAAGPAVGLSALEARVGALETARADVPALATRLQALEARGAGPGTAETEQRLAAVVTLAAQLSERLAALESRAGVTPDPAAPSARALDGEVDSLRADLEKLSQSLAAQGAQAGQRLDALDARMASTASDLGNRPTSPDFNDLKLRVEAVERRDSASALKQATYALALTSLGTALRSGGAYTESLETARLLAPGDAELATLSAHASSGVPTVTALARDFPAVARAAADADRSATNRSVWDRVWSSLSWLVTVRRTEITSGESTGAALAAMQSALAAQDLDGALAAAEGLSAPARKSMASWLARAHQRQDAEAALRAMQARAVGALAASVAGLANAPPQRSAQ